MFLLLFFFVFLYYKQIGALMNGVVELYKHNDTKGMTLRQNVNNIAITGKNVSREIVLKKYNKCMSNVIEDGKFYIVPYRLPNGDCYEIKIDKLKKGPNTNDIILFDEKDNDVTLKFKKLLGPNKDFHKIGYTPKMLGLKKLTIKKSTDLFSEALKVVSTFEECDIISV